MRIRTSSFAFPILLSAFLLTGCSSVSEVRDYGQQIPKGKGILLVSVDTDTKITKLLLTDVHSGSEDVAAADFPLGRSVHAIVLPAGDYAWTRVDLPDLLRPDSDYSPEDNVYKSWVDIGRHQGNRYTFSVKPGVVNYPGDFVIQGGANDTTLIDWFYNSPGVHPIPNSGYYFQLIDRLAMFVDRLDADTKGLIGRAGLVYSGPGADDYPAYRKASASGAPLPAAGPTSTVPSDQPIPVADFFLRPAYTDATLSPDGHLVVAVTHPNHIYSTLTVTDLTTGAMTPVFQTPNPDESFDELQWIAADTAIFLVDSGKDDQVLMMMRWRRAPDGKPDVQLKQWGGKYWVMQSGLQGGKELALGETYGADTDLHRCMHIADVDTEAETLAINPCGLELDRTMVGWNVDQDGQLVMRVVYSKDGMLHFQERAAGDASPSGWKEFKQIDPVKQTFKPVGSYYGNNHLAVLSDLGRDTVAYEEYDPDADKVVKTLFANDESDVTDVHYDHTSGTFTYLTWFSGPEPHHEMLGTRSRAAMPALQAAFPGQQVLPWGFSKDGGTALAYVYSDTDPGAFYAFDMKAQKPQRLGAAMPWLSPANMAPEKSGSVKTKDGLTIDYLLTLPPTNEKSHPLVVIPHGGPVGVFDARSFDREAQFLASRGYAVLKVNYRGSGGKGLKFQQAGEKEWGLKIEDDIDEAVHAVLGTAPVDANRVCIFGASYGGYSALVSAAREPALYKCAASLDGVTDIPLLYDASDVQQDASMRKSMVEIIGDPTTDADKLRSVSPVYLAAKIQCPVLLAQGEKDTQVDPEQAYRMKTVLESLHKRVVYLTYPKEGHGFDNPPDETDFYTQLLAFLDENIGPAAAGHTQADVVDRVPGAAD